tara:strand:+ start:7003 stop:7233 length:231 start_codon:yes stop_codon:yes gene_type:complete
MIYKYPDPVIKAIDFVLYSCSGWACVAAYIDHHSTLFALGIAFCSLIVSIYFKHKTYRLEEKKLEVEHGTKIKESS